LLEETVQLIQPSLAGKDKRFAEKPFNKISDSVKNIAVQLVDQFKQHPGAPVIIFGHSLGGILAYELARLIESEFSPRTIHLVVSGSASPLQKRKGNATGLSDDDFVREIELLAGYTHPALADREMRGLLLPALRADVEMHESYSHNWTHPSEINITSVRGKDDQIVAESDAEQWCQVTRGNVNLIEAEGGHMFWVDAPAFLISTIKVIANDLTLPEVINVA
jgi:surfactin synthase thioesterase subunit